MLDGGMARPPLRILSGGQERPERMEDACVPAQPLRGPANPSPRPTPCRTAEPGHAAHAREDSISLISDKARVADIPVDEYVTLVLGTNCRFVSVRSTVRQRTAQPPAMADDLVRNHVELIRLSEAVPVTYERVRQLAHAGEIPTDTSIRGRLHVDRDFALDLIQLDEAFTNFTTATKLLTAMTRHENGLSTSIDELCEIFDVSEHRMKIAATNAKGVEAVAGAVETDAAGLVNLREYLSNQAAA